MHNLAAKGKQNSAPWEIPFTERLRRLREYGKQGYKLAVLLYDYPDSTSFRYRGYNIVQAMNQADASAWKGMYFFKDELTLLEPFWPNIQVVTLVRMKWSFELEYLIGRLKVQRIPVLFDVDDLVFDVNRLPVLLSTLNVNNTDMECDHWFSYFSRLYLTAARVDGYVTTNDYLGERLSEKFGRPYQVIPNFMNEEQLAVSSLYAAQKKKSGKPFTIGYFSGTPSHVNDFSMAAPELLQLLLDYDEIHLTVVGHMEFPSQLQALIRQKRISRVPLVDFLELQRLIAQVDINIAPLVDNEFTNCKSELKFFEAAIVKTLTCATPTYLFARHIEEGKNGFLCRQGEWYDKIRDIYLQKVNVDRINQTAYEYALAHYSGQAVLPRIEECYNRFSGREKL